MQQYAENMINSFMETSETLSKKHIATILDIIYNHMKMHVQTILLIDSRPKKKKLSTPDKINLFKDIQSKIAHHVSNYYLSFRDTIRQSLMPKTPDPQAQILLHNFVGDGFRLVEPYLPQDAKKNMRKQINGSYQLALTLAETSYGTCHPAYFKQLLNLVSYQNDYTILDEEKKKLVLILLSNPSLSYNPDLTPKEQLESMKYIHAMRDNIAIWNGPEENTDTTRKEKKNKKKSKK